VETEGFKGVLLLTLIIASLMVPAIATITVSVPSTFSASPGVTLSPTSAMANTWIEFTVTVTNDYTGDNIDNVVLLASGFTQPTDLKPTTWDLSAITDGVRFDAIGDNVITPSGSETFVFLWTTPDITTQTDYMISVLVSKEEVTYTVYENLGGFMVTIDSKTPTLIINVTQVRGTPPWTVNVIGTAMDNAKATITITSSETLQSIGPVTVENSGNDENFLPPITMTTTDNLVYTGTFTVGAWDDNAPVVKVASAKDLVGNEITNIENSFTVDTRAPTFINNGLSALVSGMRDNVVQAGTGAIFRYVDNTASKNIAIIVEDNVANADNDVWVTSVTIDATAALRDPTQDNRWTKTITLSEGLNSIVKVTATDRTGNTKSDNIENLFIDTKLPTITFNTVAGKTWDENGELINDNTPEIRITVLDPGYPTGGLGVARIAANNDNLRVAIDNDDNVLNGSPYSFENLENRAAWDPSTGVFENLIDNAGKGLANGAYWINVVASDNLAHAGTFTVRASRSFTIETQMPLETKIYPAADVHAFGGYGTGHSRSQLKFDIHSIPFRSNILSAKLWLHRLAADNWDGETLLNRVDDQLWSENITASEFDAQALTNEETQTGKFISPGWDYLDVENQLSVDHEAGHTYSSYRLRWENDNGGEPSVGIDDGRLLAIESELDELSIIFSSSEYNGRDPYLEVVYFPPHEWELIEARTGTIEAHFVWQLIQTWTGTVQAPAEWQLVETWTGTVQATSPWRLIEAWTGVIEVPALWQHIETWTGTIRTIGWKLIETWTGTVKALVPVLPAPSLISPADGTITDDSTPTFDWSDVAEAENYDLLVDDDADLSSPEIQVTVPVSTYTLTVELPDGTYSWKVRARDAAGNVGDWSSIWTLLISAARGVDVFTSPSHQSGLPGATLSYTVTVKNEGNISDTYALTVADSAGWGPTLSRYSLALGPKAYDTVTLTVTIPTDASVGDQDNITITAKSTVDPTVSDSAKCTAQATAIRRRVEVSISPGSKSGPPEETLTYTVTIVNEGDADDTYDLTVTDALAWSASVSPASLTIAAGSSGTATVVVIIPDGTASGIEDEITIKATSRADLTVSDSATCIASTAAVRGVKVSISPETKSGPPDEMLTYTVTVKNEGNVGDTYILSTAGAPDWSPRVENTSLTLSAGEIGETTLTVTIPPGASEGASKTVTVTAISVGDPTVVDSVTCRAMAKGVPARAEELIPLAILAFLIGAAILTAAYLLYVRSKRAARRRVLRGPRRLRL